MRIGDRFAQRARFEFGIEVPGAIGDARQNALLQLTGEIEWALVLIELHLRFAKLECVRGHGRYDAARHDVLLFFIDTACAGSPSNLAIASPLGAISISSSALNVMTFDRLMKS